MKGNRAIILCTSSYEEGTGGAMGVTRKRRASESGSNMLPMLALDLLRCSRGRAEGTGGFDAHSRKKTSLLFSSPQFLG